MTTSEFLLCVDDYRLQHGRSPSRADVDAETRRILLNELDIASGPKYPVGSFLFAGVLIVPADAYGCRLSYEP